VVALRNGLNSFTNAGRNMYLREDNILKTPVFKVFLVPFDVRNYSYSGKFLSCNSVMDSASLHLHSEYPLLNNCSRLQMSLLPEPYK
jgi:hypothetical protein